MIQIVWEFKVKPDAVERFEQMYGSLGTWIRLFERFDGYRGTVLLRDTVVPRRYLTIDSWETLELRAAMLAATKAEYAQLDGECNELTESELEIGVFTTISAGGT